MATPPVPVNCRNMSAVKSGTCVNIFVAAMAWNDRHRDWEGAGGLGQVGDERPGPVLAGAGCQHEDADIGVLVNQLDDFLCRIAFTDHPIGCDPCDPFRPRGEL